MFSLSKDMRVRIASNSLELRCLEAIGVLGSCMSRGSTTVDVLDDSEPVVDALLDS